MNFFFFLTTIARFLPSCTSEDTQWFITGALKKLAIHLPNSTLSGLQEV